MVKNIFNWTVGGFFRSLGRILCYIVVGVAIAYLIGASDIKPKIKISDLLGIEKVSALSLDGTYSRMVNVTQQNGNIRLYNIVGTTVHQTTQVTWSWTNGFNSGTDNYAIFNIQGIEMSTDGGISYQSNNEYAWQNYVVNQFIISVQMMSSGAWQACEFQSNKLICPMFPDVNYTGLFFEFNPLTTTYGYDIRFNVNHYASLYKTDSSAIIQGQQETTNAVTNQTEIISDTNTTAEENATAEFFSENHTTADGPLSSIVSAPLALIHNLTTGSSNPLCFTLKGKQSCLPSGQFIWGKTTRTGIDWFGGGALSSGISAFVALFNLVVGGFLAYKMVISLFRIVEGLLNPKSTKVEVIKL